MLPYVTLFSHTFSTYYWGYAAALVITLAVNILTRKRFGYKLSKAVIYTLMTFVYGVAGAMLMAALKTAAFGPDIIGGEEYTSKVCLYGSILFLPAFEYLTAKLAHESWLQIMDFTAPGVFIILTGSKISCTMFGCCFGRSWPWGVHSSYINSTVFPVQPFEAASILLVVIIVMLYMFRSKSFIKGSTYPLGTILYAVTRFIWEFFRYYADKTQQSFLFGLTLWQVVSVIAIVLAAVWLAVLIRKSRAAPQPEVTSL